MSDRQPWPTTAFTGNTAAAGETYWVACLMAAAVHPGHIAELAMFDQFAPELRADIERFFSFFLSDRLNGAERERLYWHLQTRFIRRCNLRISA